MSDIALLVMNKPLGKHTPFFQTIPWRFIQKLSIIQILGFLSIALLSTTITRNYIKDFLITQIENQLKDSIYLTQKNLDESDLSIKEWCQNLNPLSKYQYSLLNEQGELICPIDNSLGLKDLNVERGQFNSQIKRVESEERLFLSTKILIEDDKYIIEISTSLNETHKAISLIDQKIYQFIVPIVLLILLTSLLLTFYIASPLRSILKKVDRIKTIASKKNQDPDFLKTDDQWIAVEKTLDQTLKNLETYINELVNENKKISTLIESISDSILAIDKNGTLLFANRHFKKNFTPELNRSLRLIKYWEITRDLNLTNLIEKCLTEKTIVKLRSHPMMIKLKQGEAYFDITVSPLIDYANEIIGTVCVFHDVTEKIKAEQMREDFVTNVSHEVRTPLTAMKGHVQILKNKLDQSESSILKSLKVIEKNSDRLTILFQDILNLSVIEATQKITKAKISTEELTENVLTNVRQSYPDKSMKIEKSFQCSEIWGDTPLLEQVITNLIDNAFKYTPEKGELKLVWQKHDDKIIFEIHDNASPISQEHYPRIFERFYRIDSSRSRQLGGTGLGLSIVKHIVNKHNGSIIVQKSELGGNAFILHFPLKKDQEGGPSISYI